MKILFLSHKPHESHIEFARAVNAKIKILPFNELILYFKKNKILDFLYPIICFFYSFLIKTNKGLIIVEGGSSLYTAAFLKWRHKNIKIIYLDCDFFFYKEKFVNPIIKFAIKKIDAAISVSEQNKNYALKHLNVPIEVCPPFPKFFKKIKIKKKNYGLYVGRLDPEKNIKRIIAFGLQCPYIEKFIVVGDGLLKKYVEKIAKNNKKILYFCQRDDLGKFYGQCKFLIHIPDSDPYSCTTIEAALHGCFPIISNGVGAKYLFDKIFIINNPNDLNEINKKIKFILENEKRAKNKLKKSIQKIITKKESINNFKTKINMLIKKLT